MTVKELKEQLEKFDENLEVKLQIEDYYSWNKKIYVSEEHLKNSKGSYDIHVLIEA